MSEPTNKYIEKQVRQTIGQQNDYQNVELARDLGKLFYEHVDDEELRITFEEFAQTMASWLDNYEDDITGEPY